MKLNFKVATSNYIIEFKLEYALIRFDSIFARMCIPHELNRALIVFMKCSD